MNHGEHEEHKEYLEENKGCICILLVNGVFE
jgi:hypothetical protein